MNDRPWSYLTGTRVVSWPGFFILLPYSLISMFMSNSDLAGASVSLRVIAAIAAQALLFGLLLGWRAIVRRAPSIGDGPVRVLLGFAVVVLIRSVVLAMLLAALGVSAGVDWPRRLIGAEIGFTQVLAIVDVVLASILLHRERVSSLRAREEAAIALRDSAYAEMAAARDNVATRIQVELIERIDSLAEEDPAAALHTLRSTATELVRPLSHELARAHEIERPSTSVTAKHRFDVRAFLEDATTGRPLEPFWVAVLFLGFAAPYLLITLPFWSTVGTLALAAVAIWGVLTITNRLLEHFDRGQALAMRVLLLLSSIVVTTAIFIALSFLLVQVTDDLRRTVVLSNVTLIPTLTIALVIARAARVRGQSFEAQLEAAVAALDWESARATGLQWRQQRALARSMHGPVQSAVGAAAIRLEQAVQADTADRELLAVLRTQIVNAVERIEFDSDAASVESALAEFAETWAGVCEIRWDIDTEAMHALDRDQVANFVTRELATEGCWNAIRHANATAVQITVEVLDEHSLRLAVVDDGATSLADHGPGLGSSMFDDMTLSWSRERRDDATVLQARVPAELSQGAR